MLNRKSAETLIQLAKSYPVVVVTGPRQSGKTTLTKFIFKEKPYVLLEEPDKMEFANSDPKRFLSQYPNGAILDEIQRAPQLLSYLQGILDDSKKCGLFILTGSQQFGLMSKITQSLAGRVGILELLPFSIEELKKSKLLSDDLDDVMFKGFYPPIYDRKINPSNWYSNYIFTYIERDLRQMIMIKDLSNFQKFVRMCASRVGQLLNLSSLANDCGITHNTAKSWISLLETSYILFQLRPYHKNFGKRLVKTSKLYFFDTGLVCWLLGIENKNQITHHAMRGQIFENLIVSELVKKRYNSGFPSNLYFWRDNIGNEVDVFIEHPNLFEIIEIKSGQTVTKDFFVGINKFINISSKEETKIVAKIIYGGNESYVRSDINVVSWCQ